MNRKRVKLSDQVRRAVNDSDLSRYVMCKMIDMDQAIMSRFMTGKGGLSMANLDALADLLGLDVVASGRHPDVPMRKRGRPPKGKVRT